MPYGSIDPSTLEGDDLVRWYRRTPWEVEQERQAARRQQYNDFFGVNPGDDDPDDPPDVAGSGDQLPPQIPFPAPSIGTTGSVPGLLGDLSWLRSQLSAQNGNSPPNAAEASGEDQTHPAAMNDSAVDATSDGSTTDDETDLDDGSDDTLGARDTQTSNPTGSSAVGAPSVPRPPSPVRAQAAQSRPPAPPAQTPIVPPAGSRPSPPAVTYGSLRAYLPSDQEMADLRRQQAAQQARTNKLDIQNSWFAAPALLPPLVVLALEGGAALAARAALPKIPKPPLDFPEGEPYLRVGDNWATRAGRRAHAALKDMLRQKAGWEYEPKIRGQPKVKPDVGTPQRNPLQPDKRYYLELKPNTPTGRAAGAKAAARYSKVTGQKVRPIFYDPKDYL